VTTSIPIAINFALATLCSLTQLKCETRQEARCTSRLRRATRVPVFAMLWSGFEDRPQSGSPTYAGMPGYAKSVSKQRKDRKKAKDETPKGALKAPSRPWNIRI